MANSRRRRNFLEKLRINRALLEGENNIKEEGRWFSSVTVLDRGMVADLCGDKAPGPNGFTLAFWQDCWNVVKSELWRKWALAPSDWIGLDGVSQRQGKSRVLELGVLWFEACSGLKINMEKSELIYVGDVQNVEEYDEVWGARRGVLHKGGERRFGLGVWKAIRNEWNVFKANTRLKVGSGIGMKF
ncbi:hypothetical protein CK203_030048 [Vitis vinifera]|uniref:Reverse transcriptase domain-containing protein n=1 Tax=Vitis vinifera TaxID=29760 RepID=A0A438IK39_VITVI|nr:hypothetical protein CK203_030048 [Vitis vinifera]